MPQTTTLEDLVKNKLDGTLVVTSIGDLSIVITNDPDYSASTWTVTATGSPECYSYPLFGNAALALTDISISLTYQGTQKAAKGLIRADLDFGGIDFQVEITLSSMTESFDLISQLSKKKPVAMQAVVSRLSPHETRIPEAMAGTLIDQIAMSIENADHNGWTMTSQGRLTQTGFLPFSAKAASLSLMVEYAGREKVVLTRLQLEGNTRIGKSGNLSLVYSFSQQVSALTGKLDTGAGPPIVFEDIAGALGLETSGLWSTTLSSPKGLDMASGNLRLDFSDNSLLLAGRNSRNDKAFIHIGTAENTRTLALGVAAPEGWKPGDLYSAFAKIDKVLNFGPCYLALANHAVSIDKAVFPALGDHGLNLTPGLNIGMTLVMDASQSSLLGKAFAGLLGGTPELLLQAGIAPSPGDTAFSANLGNLDLHLDIPCASNPAIMKINQAMLQVTPEPSITVSGDVLFPAPRQQTIEVTGAVTAEEGLGGPVLSFVGNVHEQGQNLTPPQNASGLVLTDIGASFSIAPETFEIGMHGSMLIDRQRAAFAFAFMVPELNPTFLSASYEHLDLAPMFKALCSDACLPEELSSGISFSNLLIWSCSDTSGTCRVSETSSYAAGFGFHGDANVFNFPANARLWITTSGMSGRLSMGKPLVVPGVFTVADATDRSSGPQFSFNTSGPPYLHASYFVDVLGFSDTTSLNLTSEGFSLSATIRFKGEDIRLSCLLVARSPGHYVASISANANFESHPIDLGNTVKLMRLTISMSSTTETFSVKATAKVGGVVTKKANVTIRLTAIEHKLALLGKAIEQELSNIRNWL